MVFHLMVANHLFASFAITLLENFHTDLRTLGLIFFAGKTDQNDDDHQNDCNQYWLHLI